jgi:hypothetical protein
MKRGARSKKRGARSKKRVNCFLPACRFLLPATVYAYM